MSISPRSRPSGVEVEKLVAAYRTDLIAAGMYAGHPTLSYARSFLSRVGIQGWARLALEHQCATSLRDRRAVGWLIVTGRLRPTADYLVVGKPYVGEMAARHQRAFHERFTAASMELGFVAKVTQLQWSALVKIAALAGVSVEQLTQPMIDQERRALTDAIIRQAASGRSFKQFSGAVFGAQTVLFHLDILAAPPSKRGHGRTCRHSWQPPRAATSSRCGCRCARRRWSDSKRRCASSPAG